MGTLFKEDILSEDASPAAIRNDVTFSQMDKNAADIWKFVDLKYYNSFIFNEVKDREDDFTISSAKFDFHRIGFVLTPKSDNANMFIYEIDGEPVAGIIIYVGNYAEGGKNKDPDSCLLRKRDDSGNDVESDMVVADSQEPVSLRYTLINFLKDHELKIDILKRKEKIDKVILSEDVAVNQMNIIPPKSAYHSDRGEGIFNNYCVKLSRKEDAINTGKYVTPEKIKPESIKELGGDKFVGCDSLFFSVTPADTIDGEKFSEGIWRSGNELFYSTDNIKSGKGEHWLEKVNIRTLIGLKSPELMPNPEDVPKNSSIKKIHNGFLFSKKITCEFVREEVKKQFECGVYDSGFPIDIVSVSKHQYLYLPSTNKFSEYRGSLLKDEDKPFPTKASYNPSGDVEKTSQFTLAEIRPGQLSTSSTGIGFKFGGISEQPRIKFNNTAVIHRQPVQQSGPLNAPPATNNRGHFNFGGIPESETRFNIGPIPNEKFGNVGTAPKPTFNTLEKRIGEVRWDFEPQAPSQHVIEGHTLQLNNTTQQLGTRQTFLTRDHRFDGFGINTVTGNDTPATSPDKNPGTPPPRVTDDSAKEKEYGVVFGAVSKGGKSNKKDGGKFVGKPYERSSGKFPSLFSTDPDDKSLLFGIGFAGLGSGVKEPNRFTIFPAKISYAQVRSRMYTFSMCSDSNFNYERSAPIYRLNFFMSNIIGIHKTSLSSKEVILYTFSKETLK